MSMFLGITSFSQDFELYRTISGDPMDSEKLGYQVGIEVTVPLEYDEKTPSKYPVIFIFDKQNERSYNYIRTTIDYLTSNDQMPASVVVGVTSGEGMRRYNETQLSISDSTAYGEKNEAFIFEELLPHIQSNFQGGEHLTLIGHSRYGYFTSLLLTRNPERLGAVISMSPFMEQKNVSLFDELQQMTNTVKLDQPVYYRFDIGEDYPDDYMKVDSLIVEDKLTSPYFDIRGELFPAAGHTVTPGLFIGEALYDIFEFWADRQAVYLENAVKEFSQIEGLLSEIEDHYGSALPFSLGVLNGKGWFFYGEGEYEKAIQAWEIMLVQYPNFSDGYFNIATAKHEMGLDIQTELAQFKESLKTSTFYSEEEKEGYLKELEELDW